MNFDLEDNEMRIFSEDEAMLTSSLASDLSKFTNEAVSPLEEAARPPPTSSSTLPSKRGPSTAAEATTASPKTRKMSFREKFKRFTSPTPNRKSLEQQQQQESGSSGNSSSSSAAPSRGGSEVKEIPSGKKSTPAATLKDKIVCALSPESLRKKTTSSSASDSATNSPQKKKKFESSVPPIKPAETANASSSTLPDVGTEEEPQVMSSNGLPLSPSINFIDASMNESAESGEVLGEEVKTVKEHETGENTNRNC